MKPLPTFSQCKTETPDMASFGLVKITCTNFTAAFVDHDLFNLIRELDGTWQAAWQHVLSQHLVIRNAMNSALLTFLLFVLMLSTLVICLMLTHGRCKLGTPPVTPITT